MKQFRLIIAMFALLLPFLGAKATLNITPQAVVGSSNYTQIVAGCNNIASQNRIFLDDDNVLNDLVYKMKLKNTSSADMHVGDENYTVTLCWFSSTSNYLALKTIPVPVDIAAGEAEVVTLDWGAVDMQPAIDAKKMTMTSDGITYNTIKLFVRLDMNGTSASDLFKNTQSLINQAGQSANFLYPSINVASYNICNETGTGAAGSYDFKFLNLNEDDATKISKNFRIYANCTKDVKIVDIQVPNGFIFEYLDADKEVVEDGELATLGYKNAETNEDLAAYFRITCNTANSGAYGGNLVMTDENGLVKTLALSFAILSDDDFYEAFEVPAGTEVEGYLPEGWKNVAEKHSAGHTTSNYVTTKTTLTTVTSQGGGNYFMSMNGEVANTASASYDAFAQLISPKIEVAEGEQIMVGLYSKSSGRCMKFYWSEDGINWTLVKGLLAQSSGTYIPNAIAEDSAMADVPLEFWNGNNMKYFYLNVPAGKGYLKLRGRRIAVCNVYGGKKVIEENPDYDMKEVEMNITAISHDAYTGKDKLNVSWKYASATENDVENAPLRSASNPEEKFAVHVNDTHQVTTDELSAEIEVSSSANNVITITPVYGATNVAGVHSVYYLASNAANYAALNVTVLLPEDADIDLEETPVVCTAEDGTAYDITLNDEFKGSLASLPKGKYTITFEPAGYQPYAENLDLTGDKDLTIMMEPSAINTIAAESAQNAIYTITGVKVNAKNINSLPAGLYIINGKKIVVK